MDLDFNEEQEMLRGSAREFLRNECPIRLVREAEQSAEGYAPGLWRQMADLGWLGLPLPEAHGGSGGGYLDAIALIEELGRAVAPVPYLSTVVIGGLTLAEFGSEEQRRQVLPAIAAGEAIVAYAHNEEDAGWTPAAIAATARRDGDGYVLSGLKLFVAEGEIADYFLVLARTAPQGGAGGMGMFLVPAKQEGIRTGAMDGFGSDRMAEVEFKDVRLAASALVGGEGRGWEIAQWALARGAIAQCTFTVGAMAAAFEMSVEYAKNRVQFGKPIGSFQAIQHHCANMAVDLDGARLITYQTAWKLDQGLAGAADVAQAKVWVNQAAQRVSILSHQVHGGIGATWDYDLHMFTRRIKAADGKYGSADYHRAIVADALEEDATALLA
jgi:alkylation response protein AidB-like acyl-CoA dehydrogenase